MRSGWYLGGIAILAAALSNPLVESLANRGWLGGAVRFDDNDHASVIPALLVGLVVALGVSFRRGLEYDRDRAPAAWIDIVWVVGLQFAVLFLMESAEQFASGGAPAAGLAWLGGPVLASLAVHAAVGVLTALLAARVVRSIAVALASIVRAVIGFTLAITSRAATPPFVRRRDVPFARRQVLFAPQIGGRAPPLNAAH